MRVVFAGEIIDRGALDMRDVSWTLVGIMLLTLFGCAAQVTPPVGRFEVISIPEEGSVHSAELGDRLLSKLEKTTVPSVRILEDYLSTGNELGIKVFVKAGLCAPRGSKLDGTKLFAPVEAYLVGGPVDGKQVAVKPVELYNGKLCWGDNQTECIPSDAWRHEQWVDQSRPYFEQELIYNGRVENNLRFIYREYAGSLAKGAFTQEIQYDLNDSAVIGFKGARIEILSASNITIEYRLVSNFP